MSARHDDFTPPGEAPDWRADRPADRPVADEPHTWAESWPFIACVGVIAIGIYIARSQGWLP